MVVASEILRPVDASASRTGCDGPEKKDKVRWQRKSGTEGMSLWAKMREIGEIEMSAFFFGFFSFFLDMCALY